MSATNRTKKQRSAAAVVGTTSDTTLGSSNFNLVKPRNQPEYAASTTVFSRRGPYLCTMMFCSHGRGRCRCRCQIKSLRTKRACRSLLGSSSRPIGFREGGVACETLKGEGNTRDFRREDAETFLYKTYKHAFSVQILRSIRQAGEKLRRRLAHERHEPKKQGPAEALAVLTLWQIELLLLHKLISSECFSIMWLSPVCILKHAEDVSEI